MPDPLQTFARELAPDPEQVEQLVARLDHARQTPRPNTGLLRPALALAAAALIGVSVSTLRDPEIGLRGLPVASPEQATGVQLRLALEQDGALSQLSRGQGAAVGDRVFFRVSTEEAAAVTVWVEGPGGAEVLSRFSVSGPGAVDVPSGDGLQAWRFDQPGRYRFYASSQGSDRCLPATCSSRAVVVR